MTSDRARRERERLDLLHSQIALIEQSFQFLESEWGLRREQGSRTRWHFALAYVNEVAGVQVHYEFRDVYVHLMLCRLVEGRLQPNERQIRPNDVLNCYDLNDFVQLRAPEEVVHTDPLLPWPPGGLVESVIERQARNLRRYGREVIGGDFSAFPDLDRVVKARAGTTFTELDS